MVSPIIKLLIQALHHVQMPGHDIEIAGRILDGSVHPGRPLTGKLCFLRHCESNERNVLIGMVLELVRKGWWARATNVLSRSHKGGERERQ